MTSKKQTTPPPPVSRSSQTPQTEAQQKIAQFCRLTYLVVVGEKGGSGKSFFTSLSIAYLLQLLPKEKLAIFDCDRSNPTTKAYWGDELKVSTEVSFTENEDKNFKGDALVEQIEKRVRELSATEAKFIATIKAQTESTSSDDSEFKDGKIADGNTAIAVGFDYAVKQIFFLALSATTSTALVLGLIAHSKRDAIIISFADEAEREVNAFFELYAQIEPQTDAEREALDAIARYHQQHVLQGGVVGILSLIEFIRYAQQQGLIKVAAPNDETVRATSLLEEIDGCIYQIRRILHILATTVKPHTYGLQTNLTVTTDGLITGDVDEVPFVFGQMLRQLRSLVAQIKDAAEIAKKDVTALVTRSAEVYLKYARLLLYNRNSTDCKSICST